MSCADPSVCNDWDQLEYLLYQAWMKGNITQVAGIFERAAMSNFKHDDHQCNDNQNHSCLHSLVAQVCICAKTRWN